MNLGTEEVVLTILVLILALLMPLIPTVVIYWLFPKGNVTVSGPLKGLTLKAAGAFAAYIVIFLAVEPLVWATVSTIKRMTAPTWHIQGALTVLDANGQPITNVDQALQGMKVTFSPPTFAAPGGQFWVDVPETDHGIPAITISVPGFQDKTLYLDGKQLRIDGVAQNENLDQDREGTNHIVLQKPISLVVDPAGEYAASAAGPPLKPVTAPIGAQH